MAVDFFLLCGVFMPLSSVQVFALLMFYDDCDSHAWKTTDV
jgi:hypothetical protein